MTTPGRLLTIPRLLRVDLDQLAEEEVEQRDVVIQRRLVGIDEMLNRQAYIERDHRGRDLLRGERRRPSDLLEGLIDLLGEDRPVAAPERGRELAELLIPCGLGEAFEPQPEQPSAALVLLHVPDALDPPAQPLARGPRLLLSLLGHLGVLPVHAVLEQLDEELVLALEVGVEGAAREARLARDLFDARALQPSEQEDALRRIEQQPARLGLLLLAAQARRSTARHRRLTRCGHLRRA